MVCTEEALKFMENRAKKSRKLKRPKVMFVSPLASPSVNEEKQKHVEFFMKLAKGSCKHKKDMGLTTRAEFVAIVFLPKPSICSNLEAFA